MFRLLSVRGALTACCLGASWCGWCQENFPDPRNITNAFYATPGFRIELVASEPDLSAPVAMAFDENGRLFVAERPADRPQAGQIRVLEDPDGSGNYKNSVIFADAIPYPGPIACYDGGVFVAAGAQILYLKDSNRTGRADINRVVLSGFSPLATNSSGAAPVIHSLQWGPDLRIHGGTIAEGGSLVSTPNSSPVSLGHNDFSFDPRTLDVATEAGPSRSGLAFDLRGRKFVCDPQRPLRIAVYPPRHWERNPFFPPPPAIMEVARPPLPVFRPLLGETNASWVEGPPRPGANDSETNQFAAAWLRSAQGLIFYSHTAFPRAYIGNAFVADPENHLIHRMVVRENGLIPVAERAPEEQRTEFLLAKTPQFRPVNLAVGPEGGLYVADYSDGTRGRIFRMLPSDFQQPKPTNWAKASALDLAAGVISTNGWHRSTAMRLLKAGNEPAAAPLLSNVIFRASSPLARRTALQTLSALGSLTEPVLTHGLTDREAMVREAALVAAVAPAFAHNASSGIPQRLKALAGDAAIEVRYQLALTLGAFEQGGRNPLLETLLRRDVGNLLIERAALGSLEPSAANTLGRLANDAAYRNSPAGQALLSQLAAMLGVRGDLEEATQTLGVLTGLKAPAQPLMLWLYQFGAGLQRTRSSIALIDVQSAYRAAYPNMSVAALDSSISVPARAAAIRAVGVSPYVYSDVGDWMLALLNPSEVPAIQSATLDSLQHFPAAAAGAGIVDRWSLIAPALRYQAGNVLTYRYEWSTYLLSAVQAGRINPAELSPTTVNFLRFHSDPALSQRAVQLLGAAPLERPQIIRNFTPALKLVGSPGRGRDIYTARCAACHAPPPVLSIGGNIAASVALGNERLLREILEPHRQINPEMRTSVVETQGGENFIGIIQRESPRAISLRQVNGTEIIIPNSNIGIIRPQAWSLMPEGLEMGLTQQGMADLIAYIQSLGATAPR